MALAPPDRAPSKPSAPAVAVARALGAAHADRRRRHAVGADRPAAARAADAGLAVGMSVAGGHRAAARTATADRPAAPGRRRDGRSVRSRRSAPGSRSGARCRPRLAGDHDPAASERPCGIATSPTPPAATTKTDEGWTGRRRPLRCPGPRPGRPRRDRMAGRLATWSMPASPSTSRLPVAVESRRRSALRRVHAVRAGSRSRRRGSRSRRRRPRAAGRRRGRPGPGAARARREAAAGAPRRCRAARPGPRGPDRRPDASIIADFALDDVHQPDLSAGGGSCGGPWPAARRPPGASQRSRSVQIGQPARCCGERTELAAGESVERVGGEVVVPALQRGSSRILRWSRSLMWPSALPPAGDRLGDLHPDLLQAEPHPALDGPEGMLRISAISEWLKPPK